MPDSVEVIFDTPLRPGYDEEVTIRWDVGLRGGSPPMPVAILRTDGRFHPTSDRLLSYLLSHLSEYERSLEERAYEVEAEERLEEAGYRMAFDFDRFMENR